MFRLVPPEIHGRNAAERHIQTWNNHLISGLSSCTKGSPLNFWCYLIPKGCLTLNLLQKYHMKPNLLSQSQLHGIFDFNATPLAPPGKKCLLHEKKGSRESWAVIAINGWYVNRGKYHYRCYQVIPENLEVKYIRHSGITPHGCAMPFRSAAENAIILLNKLVHALKTMHQYHLLET